VELRDLLRRAIGGPALGNGPIDRQLGSKT
jgi:hypothetical protein